jgi:hypothetical protein
MDGTKKGNRKVGVGSEGRKLRREVEGGGGREERKRKRNKGGKLYA